MWYVRVAAEVQANTLEVIGSCSFRAFEEFELALNQDFCVILIGVEGECSGNSL